MVRFVPQLCWPKIQTLKHAYPPHRRQPAFAVRYIGQEALAALFEADASAILGIIAYGADRPAFLNDICPFATSALRVIGEPIFEVWTATSEIRYRKKGRITGACGGPLVFGVVTLDETADSTLETLIETAYVEVFAFLDEAGQAAPVRFWNYLPRITDHAAGLERYRRFNIGRHDAFSVRLKLDAPPVASALGSRGGSPLIYFLAAQTPATPIENPRQVSAFAYPPLYGPRSPDFSRASLLKSQGMGSLFISGTASIVGHESRHPGDPAAQTAETLANLEALIVEAEKTNFPARRGRWLFKIYLRDPAHRDLVEAGLNKAFGPDCDRIFLQADICRSELLLEIEAVCFEETPE